MRQILDMTHYSLDSTRHILDLTRYILDLTRYILDLTRYILDLTRRILDPTRYILDLTRRILDPTRPIFDPTRYILDLTRYILDPTRYILDLTRYILDPTRPIFDLTRYILDIARYIFDPMCCFLDMTQYLLRVSRLWREICHSEPVGRGIFTFDGADVGRSQDLRLLTTFVRNDKSICRCIEITLQGHALNIDFVNEAQGPGARVAVEMSVESARALVQTITEVLQRAESGGYLEELHTKGANHEAVARAAIYKPNPNTV